MSRRVHRVIVDRIFATEWNNYRLLEARGRVWQGNRTFNQQKSGSGGRATDQIFQLLGGGAEKAWRGDSKGRCVLATKKGDIEQTWEYPPAEKIAAQT